MARKQYPIDKVEVLRIWTSMRRVFKIDLAKVRSKKDFVKELERFRSSQAKSLAKLVKRSDFFSKLTSHFKFKSRTKVGRVYIKSYSRWTREQVEFIRSHLGMKTKDLVKMFNYEFPESPKTYSSLVTFKSRLRKGFK